MEEERATPAHAATTPTVGSADVERDRLFGPKTARPARARLPLRLPGPDLRVLVHHAFKAHAAVQAAVALGQPLAQVALKVAVGCRDWLGSGPGGVGWGGVGPGWGGGRKWGRARAGCKQTREWTPAHGAPQSGDPSPVGRRAARTWHSVRQQLRQVVPEHELVAGHAPAGAEEEGAPRCLGVGAERGRQRRGMPWPRAVRTCRK
jgi:hypothetical protein